jgi:predicted Zn-dependent protease
MQAWALQAGLLISQGKVAEAETAVLHRMKAAAGNVPQYLTALTEGFILKAKGPTAFKAAREAFLLALNLNPGSRMVLTEVLRLDYALMDAAATEAHAGDLLRLDCDDALANYLMGTLLAGRNDLEGAEAHLRRCVAAAPSATGWNDLAETLRRLKKLPEAEEAVRQALKLNPKNAFAYDTLSCVLLDSGRLQEAKQASDAARALDPKAVPLMLTEARIVARSGNQAEASERVNKIGSLGDSLTPRQRAELAALAAEIKKP